MINNNLPLKSIQLVLIAMLSACAGENTKSLTTDSSSQQSVNVSTKSVTKADRDKYRSAITALNNNELSKAQRLFSDFIRSKPKLAGAYTNLALVHFKKKELEKSLKLVNKALQLNPKQAQALNLRAQIHIENSEIHNALNDYQLAIKFKPKYVNAQYNIALLYDIYLQDIELAIKHYKIYMSLLKSPDEPTKEWVRHLEGTLKDV